MSDESEEKNEAMKHLDEFGGYLVSVLTSLDERVRDLERQVEYLYMDEEGR